MTGALDVLLPRARHHGQRFKAVAGAAVPVLPQAFGVGAAAVREPGDAWVDLVACRCAAARFGLTDLAQQTRLAQPVDRRFVARAGQRLDQRALARPAQHPGPHQQIAGGRVQHPIPQRAEQQVLGQLRIQRRQRRIDDLCLFLRGRQAAGFERTMLGFPGQDRLRDQRIEKLDRARMTGEPLLKRETAGFRQPAQAGKPWQHAPQRIVRQPAERHHRAEPGVLVARRGQHREPAGLLALQVAQTLPQRRTLGVAPRGERLGAVIGRPGLQRLQIVQVEHQRRLLHLQQHLKQAQQAGGRFPRSRLLSGLAVQRRQNLVPVAA